MKGMRLKLTIALFIIGVTYQECIEPIAETLPTTVNVGEPRTYTQAEIDAMGEETFCPNVATSAGGICCAPTDLYTYWNSEWKTDLATKLDSLKDDLAAVDPATVKTTVQSLNTVVADMFTNGFFGTSPNIGQVQTDVQAILTSVVESDLFDTDQISDLPETVEQCKQDYFDFKTRGVCLFCAGDSLRFYDQSTRTVSIYHNVCDDLVRSCGRLFGYSAILTRLTKELVLALQETAIASLITIDTGESSLTNEQLDAIESCAEDADACVQDLNTKIEVCGLFSIRGANEDFEGDLETIEALAGIMTVIPQGITAYNTAQAAQAAAAAAAAGQQGAPPPPTRILNGASFSQTQHDSVRILANMINDVMDYSRRLQANGRAGFTPVTDSDQGADLTGEEYESGQTLDPEDPNDDPDFSPLYNMTAFLFVALMFKL